MCQKCYSKAYHRRRYDNDPTFVATMRERARSWRSRNLQHVRDTDYKRHTQRRFGMPYTDYLERVEAQANLCAICHWCNAGLGQFHDDVVRLRAAADYVDFWQQHHAKGDANGR